MTNGTSIEIGYTGTELTLRPGTIHGGEVEFDCGLDRGIGYFLEPLMILAPFSKFVFRVSLSGITAEGDLDHCVDSLKNVACRILEWFGVSEEIQFKILRRGAPPAGGGQVYFECPILQSLKPIFMTDEGKIRKIRGVASTTRVSPQIANRLIEGSKSRLSQFIPDIYIYSDVSKGSEAGKSPGYSLYLQAESTTGSILSSEGIGLSLTTTVEEIVKKVARSLLKQIKQGGIVSQCYQWMVIFLMAFCPADLSKCVLGPLSIVSKELLEDIGKFTGVSFKIRQIDEEGKCMISCIGAGIVNFNRKTN